MPVTLKLEWKKDTFQRAMRKAPRAFYEEMKHAFELYMIWFDGQVGRRNMKGRPGLQNRTGFLLSSRKHVVRGKDLNSLKAVWAIGSGLAPYARIQEMGGVVKPTRGQFLAIPLDAAKTAAGVARKGPREYQDTFIARSKAGNPIIFQRREGSKNPIALFVLKRQVTIPPRLGVRDTAKSSAAKRKRQQLFRAAANAALRRATRG